MSEPVAGRVASFSADVGRCLWQVGAPPRSADVGRCGRWVRPPAALMSEPVAGRVAPFSADVGWCPAVLLGPVEGGGALPQR